MPLPSTVGRKLCTHGATACHHFAGQLLRFQGKGWLAGHCWNATRYYWGSNLISGINELDSRNGKVWFDGAGMLALFTKSHTLFYRRSNVEGKKAAKDLILARFNNPFWAW